MAKLVQYRPNLRGLRRLRSSREVDRMLERRARNVADAAELAYRVVDPDGDPIAVDVLQEGSDTRAPRARVAVIARSPQAIQLEQRHRVLGGSLDAAR